MSTLNLSNNNSDHQSSEAAVKMIEEDILTNWTWCQFHQRFMGSFCTSRFTLILQVYSVKQACQTQNTVRAAHRVLKAKMGVCGPQFKTFPYFFYFKGLLV
jgi:hypothetical protein